MTAPLCLLALSGLLLLLPAGLPAAPDPATVRGDLGRVQERIRTLETESRRDAARREALNKELKAAELAAAEARQALRATRQQLQEAGARLGQLRRQLSETEKALTGQREALAAQLRLAQFSGRNESLKTALSLDDPADLGRRLTWLGYLMRSRGELLAGIQATLAALKQGEESLEREQAGFAALEVTQQQRVASLDEARDRRARVVQDLTRQMKGQQQQLARSRSEAAGLEKLVRELQQAAARAEREAARPGRGPVVPPPEPGVSPGKPLPRGSWPVTGSVLADFGQPRAGGQLRWEGVLIGAPAGTEVRAVRAGRVVYADWLPGLGLLLAMDHGGGVLTLYGHNQNLARQVGDRVQVGDVLARVGDTGGQSRPALYFEVRKNGKPLNPRQWIR